MAHLRWRHPADCVQTAFRVRNHPWPSYSWQPPVAADFLSANQGRSGRFRPTSANRSNRLRFHLPAARHEALTAIGFTWDEQGREFRSPSGIPVQFMAAGGRAGKGSEVLLPSPADEHVAIMIEGLPVLSLAAFIEAKIACGEGDARPMHRDFADVVELIAVHGLARRKPTTSPQASA